MKISEKSLETAIEEALTADVAENGDGAAYGEGAPGGYLKHSGIKGGGDFDRELCLIPADAVDFVLATQPKEWAKLKQFHGDEVQVKFLRRLADEVQSRGTLDVLRKGIKDHGCHFRLAYFRPASGLNEETQRLYQANRFAAIRQLYFSATTGQSVDLVLFLNGLPIFTAELKNPLNHQSVKDAIYQYQHDRDPKEPLFSFRRCLAHFAVDPDLVFVTTRLQGAGSKFLPFNRGYRNGAGNPPPSATSGGYATSYLWNEVWARDSVLDLVQSFIHEVETEDADGKKTCKFEILFPRYHQLDAVRRLVRDAAAHGAGQNYLIQHSAGSGKSNSIAWHAHRLSTLHDTENRRVFDSIVVITDRKVLDRQLQKTVLAFEQTLGLVENIAVDSQQLKSALEGGKTIIVTTLQKFPVIAEKIRELPGRRFALIVDEAHSSQSGESTKSVKKALGAGKPVVEDGEAEESSGTETIEDRVVAEQKARGRADNLSTFAFTATPKAKTLELFGLPTSEGGRRPFSLYAMRQAIEEKFILDVLENYTTLQSYWNLTKKVADDPVYEKAKAVAVAKGFVENDPHALDHKVAIMLDHFEKAVASRIGGRAKAMVVTRSRRQAVRYRLAFDRALAERNLPWKALVAFSDKVEDEGKEYTESEMNGVPEAQTAATFKKPEYRFLIVAEKFQTGFDQPLLHTMYVDKKLTGVNAVQTLSRLNRTMPGQKSETMVLDFANEAEEIRQAFEPYYETTILSETTDPNLLYAKQQAIEGFGVVPPGDVEAFVRVYFDPKLSEAAVQAQVYPILARALPNFEQLDDDRKLEFRQALGDFVRLYSFLSQVIAFEDVELEKLYQYARYLRRRLPFEPGRLPFEILEQIDMASYTVRQTSSGKIALARGNGAVDPQGDGRGAGRPEGGKNPLSEILRELNERFGGVFSRETVENLVQRLSRNEALADSLRINPPENARLTFEHVAHDELQDMVDSHFDFYKRVTDDPDLKKFLFDWIFRQLEKHRRDLLSGS
jgi:type I restriction enzyme R subunit